jgi:ribosomal-protein-alanine N-acetyltransferase
MIRPATTADLPAIRSIQQASLADPWDDLLEAAVEGPPVALVATARTRGPPNTTTAGHDAGSPDGQPIAYAIAIPGTEGAYIAEFAVAPSNRGQGTGSRLMTHLLERLAADDFESVRLTVQVGDRRARSFYDSHGFRARSLVPNHYDDADALEMVRDLS